MRLRKQSENVLGTNTKWGLRLILSVRIRPLKLIDRYYVTKEPITEEEVPKLPSSPTHPRKCLLLVVAPSAPASAFTQSQHNVSLRSLEGWCLIRPFSSARAASLLHIVTLFASFSYRSDSSKALVRR